MTDKGRQLLKQRHINVASDEEEAEEDVMTTQDEKPMKAASPVKVPVKTSVDLTSSASQELPEDIKWIVDWLKLRPEFWKWFRVSLLHKFI